MKSIVGHTRHARESENSNKRVSVLEGDDGPSIDELKNLLECFDDVTDEGSEEMR